MASTSALNEAQKAMIAERLRSALERVHDSSGLDALQECRSLFRRGVPLHLRAYVAAALLLEGSEGGGSRRGRDGRGPRERGPNGRGPDERGKREQAPGGRAQARDGKSRGSERPARSAAGGESDKAGPARPSPEGEGREPPKRRERRYEGEGVTLFVSAGRRQRFYARVALDLLFETPGVSEEAVGDVRTMDNYSFITVDPAIEELVIAALDGRDFRGRALGVNRARKKGDRQDGERRDGEEGPGAYEESANDEASFGEAPFGEAADPDPSEADGL